MLGHGAVGGTRASQGENMKLILVANEMWAVAGRKQFSGGGHRDIVTTRHPPLRDTSQLSTGHVTQPRSS